MTLLPGFADIRYMVSSVRLLVGTKSYGNGGTLGKALP